MSLKLVGLSGKAGSGKDYVGRECLRPLGFSQFSLAWPMKNEAVGGYIKSEASGELSWTFVETPSYEDVHFNKPPDIRAFLQKRGTEDGWMKYGKDYWLRIADAWMRTLRENCGLAKFYVPDVRFPHEVKWIQEQGGIVIRITGDRSTLSGEAALHPSETALDGFEGFDHTLDNSHGTDLKDLHTRVRAIWWRHV